MCNTYKKRQRNRTESQTELWREVKTKEDAQFVQAARSPRAS